MAVSTGSSYDAVNRGPGMFLLSATPSAGRTVEEVEAALREQIQRIAREGVTEEELKRVKAQVIAGQVFQRDSMFSQAMQMGALDNAGLPYDSADLQAKRLQDVTAAQVQDVAKKFFIDDSLTVAVLDPQPLPTRANAPAHAGTSIK